MIPYHDENETQRPSWVTMLLIAACTLTWVFVQGAGMGVSLASSVCNLGLIPGELTGMLRAGIGFNMGQGLVCLTDPGPQYQNIFTSMFLHGGWMHLIGNMWFLWIFGNNVEDAMGHLRFVVFYLLCGAAAALLQAAFDTDSVIPMVGASGAIGGVMGAYVMTYPRVHVHLLVVFGFVTTVAVPAVFMLGYWFVLQLLSGTLSRAGQGGVAFWAHVGGFVAGVVLSFVFRDRAKLAQHPYYGWNQRQSPTRNWHRIRR